MEPLRGAAAVKWVEGWGPVVQGDKCYESTTEEPCQEQNHLRKDHRRRFADAKWYRDFVRHVELPNLAPRTRQSYLAWPRRLQAVTGRREITKLCDTDVLDFLIALRHERGLKESTRQPGRRRPGRVDSVAFSGSFTLPHRYRAVSRLPPAPGSSATIWGETGSLGANQDLARSTPAESRPAGWLSTAYSAAPTPPVLPRGATQHSALARRGGALPGRGAHRTPPRHVHLSSRSRCPRQFMVCRIVGEVGEGGSGTGGSRRRIGGWRRCDVGNVANRLKA